MPPISLVLVNSKIKVSERPFSYTPNRSIYPTEQRYEQTLATIRSVRDKIPRSYVIFVDNSELPPDMIEGLRASVDLLINPTDDSTLNADTDINPTKAVGELAQVQLGLQAIDQLDFQWKHLFKICGRYVLNDSFEYPQFDNAHNIFKVNQPLTKYKTDTAPAAAPVVLPTPSPSTPFQTVMRWLKGPPPPPPQPPPRNTTCYWTSFYKISREHYAEYKKAVSSSYDLFKTDPAYFNEPLELIFCERVRPKLEVDRLGLTINAAVENWIEDI
ncbi:hypothetical protein [Verrucomicrobium sp. BvORR106]|uniref:hypothetical protein n=1 Tax=Verrucomicrobium sp. BvORR106 TaxID=1403819 RepID=UPI000570E28F|nr:hypothetical protein [Verrucomicrobium sp. BvORR106]